MSSLTDLPELIGFFSYAREDDEDSRGALSALRERIQGELRGQLGRSRKRFRLWQDKEAIASGKLWKAEIETAIGQSVFFIPIITPTAVRSPFCRFEFNAFLAREAALSRDDLVFPILYIQVMELNDSVRGHDNPVLSAIAKRQWVDWRQFRHLDVNSLKVLDEVEKFCRHIHDALYRPTGAQPFEKHMETDARHSAQEESHPSPTLALVSAASPQIAVAPSSKPTPAIVTPLGPPLAPFGTSGEREAARLYKLAADHRPGADVSGAETAPGSRFLDPRYTAAVIFGAHDWTEAGMSRAPSFLRSAKGGVAYLIDSAGLGLDPTLVLDLFDDTASAGEQLARIRDTLDTLLRERRQEARPVADLLIYYVGHGYTDDQGHLSLLVRRSRRGMEVETGIKAPDLARVMKVAAPQQRRVVILDCCFSEAAARGFIGQSGALDQAVAATAVKDLRDDQPQRGSLLLCSSPMGEVSMGAPKAERTLFTGAVLEVLRHGVEGMPSTLSFAELRDAAYNRMVDYFGANAPRPVLHQVNATHGDLTRTPAFPNRTAAGTGTQVLPTKPGSAPLGVASVEDRMRAGRIKVDAKIIHGAPEGWFKPGAGKTEWFQDHEHAPELVVVPAGEFLMGSTDRSREKPVHTVAIPSPFAVGRFAVTFAEWDACVADGGCGGYKPDDHGWGRDRRPVINVSWDDAKLYINWLNYKTGETYRLLSEAEREYVTRARKKTPFSWGSSITPKHANYDGRRTLGGGATGEYRRQTVPVDGFKANPWGLFNVHGNVWEWCEDVWHDNYKGAPTDGSASLQGGDHSCRVVRGGSWGLHPRDLRAAFRFRNSAGDRYDVIGFRLARTLNP